MYLYFDKNGTLLEMINDEALRRYNQNVNDAYVYIESEQGPTEMVKGLSHLQYWFKKPTGKTTSVYDTDLQNIKPELYQIPVDFKRDVKYFKQGVYYKMYKIHIPCGNAVAVNIYDYQAIEDNVFEFAGPVEMGIRAIMQPNGAITLGKVVFTVENAVVKSTQGISMSQFDYLLQQTSHFTGKGIFFIDNETKNIVHTVRDMCAQTFTQEIESAKIIIPEDVTFGFICEVNFKAGNNPFLMEFENKSEKYSIRAFQFGVEIGSSILIGANKTVQMSISCDALNITIYLNIF